MTKIYQDWPQNARNSQNYVQPPFYWPLKFSNHFAALVQMIWLASRSLEFLQVNFSSICRVVLDGTSKGQIKPKAVWVRLRFSQKLNERICFVCPGKQKRKQNKFVCLFFARIYSATICFRFYPTFNVNLSA